MAVNGRVALTLLRNRLKKVRGNLSFWVFVVMLAGVTFFHYCTPQVRSLASYSLTRHATERILFILVIVNATSIFGHVGGLVTLALVVLLMLPRVFLISPYPVDAFVEVIAVAFTGYLVVWMLGGKQRAVSRLKALNAVTSVLIQSLELEQILNDVLDRILEVMNLEAGAVYLLDEEGQGFSLIAHCCLPAEITECVDGLKSARMLVRYEGLKYQLAMPLRSEGEVNGLLVIGSPEPSSSLRREVKLMTTICNEIGMVIKNAQLLQDVDRQLQIERCMYEVVEEITTELELDKVLPKVMQIAQELVGADGGIIALWDEKRDVIIYPYLHNLPRELAEVTVSEGEGLSGEVMATGRLIVVDDYQTYAKAIPEFVQAGLASVVSVPIVSGVRTFGALSLFTFDEAGRPFARDLAILAGIGRQAGIAIENAYLYDNMRFYARRITRAQENERRRIARELHDDTIQSLVWLSRRLEALAASYGQLPETTPQRIREIHELVDDMIQRVRRFSQDLRPSTLDDLGLLPTLEELTADLNRAGLQAELQVMGGKRRLASEVELTFFRIAQEASSNIMKHAQATKVVTTVELADSSIRMTIQDDGKGFKPPTPINHLAAMGKLGVIGMYERARLLGGTLVVKSEPGQGTKVVVNAPI